jgi:hypothetical protein
MVTISHTNLWTAAAVLSYRFSLAINGRITVAENDGHEFGRPDLFSSNYIMSLYAAKFLISKESLISLIILLVIL